jgi:hypothetical protein
MNTLTLYIHEILKNAIKLIVPSIKVNKNMESFLFPSNEYDNKAN